MSKIILPLLVLATLIGCKKSDTQGNPVTPVVQMDSFYFKAKFNGNEMAWIVPSHRNEASFTYIADSHHGLTDLRPNCIEGYCYYMIAGTEIRRNVADVRPRIAVGFNMATTRMGREEILSWFTLGAKSFGPSPRPATDLLNPAYNGVYVYYVDQTGKDWSTTRGPQAGSTLESVAFVDETRTDVSAKKVWKVRFTCKLYDIAGNAIQVENGELVGPILLP